MIIEIPVTSDPQSYQFQITLEGVIFLMKFWYNKRAGKWSMSLKEADGTDIVKGVPIYSSFPFMDRFRDIRLPPGTFMAYDTEGNDADPTQDDFGTRVKLLYVESES